MKELRASALQMRRQMSEQARAVASRIICQRLIRSRIFLRSRVLACYLSMPDEVNTRDIIVGAWCANKRIFVPVLRPRRKMWFRELRPDSTLVRNSFGILEPVDGDLLHARRFDLVVTPTVAFDTKNNRIGMGGGYYDRCFSFLRHRNHCRSPKLVGIAFACQKVEKITPNVWDIRLSAVISDVT